MSSLLRSYAVTEQTSRGRQFPESPHPYRSDFERDRDRIIHSSAFRRLEGKTQVFTPGLDDYYRTRLTHSIEVSQIGRTMAKALGLNESLTEAICLAHDLGHPPFGHAGEQVLNSLMGPFGGFEHNRQSLRIVDFLERPYPDFVGLNLMYETRLGLAKHRSPYDRPADGVFTEQNCSLEGQVADLADRIAYNCHDLEDGLRAGLIEDSTIQQVPLIREAAEKAQVVRVRDRTIRRTRTAKAIIDVLVSDAIVAAARRIADEHVETPAAVLSRRDNLIVLSPERETALCRLEEFLMEHFYRHPSLMETADKVRQWLASLFEVLCDKPDLMPRYFQRFIPEEGLQRAVCDYIAGMTDRFCLKMLGVASS